MNALIDRLPELSDADLKALHANAKRLSGEDGARRQAAADLLPALEAETAARVAAKPAPPPKAKRVRKTPAAPAASA